MYAFTGASCTDLFQHTAARRRLNPLIKHLMPKKTFQHTAARRRLRVAIKQEIIVGMFQHTAARRRLNPNWTGTQFDDCVSTHSRPKAAEQIKLLPQLTQVVSTHSRPKAADASSKNLMSSSLICLISLKSLKKTKNSITQPYSSLNHSSNFLIVKEQS